MRNQVTKDRLEELLHYDRENGKFVWKVLRRKVRPGQAAGTLRADEYVKIVIDRRGYLAHRLVWFVETGQWPRQIDHINRIKSDNRFSNLRVATSSQNQANTTIRKSNRTGAKGVFLDRRHPDRPFGAKISRGGRRVYLGYFATVEEAADAYNIAARKQWGVFAAS